MNPLATAEFLISLGKNADAKKVLDVMRKYCSTLQQIDAVGKLYADIREFKDCLELARQAYDLARTNQERWDARVNIIRACLNLNMPNEALRHIRINESIDSADHPNRMDKAMAYFLLNRKAEGEMLLRQILEEPRTDDVDNRVRFNLGTYELVNGDFKTGLRKVLLDGRKLNIWHRYSLPAEMMWEGGVQPGKTILMCAEGGMGDEIISVRFQKHFRDVGMRPIWYTSRHDLAAVFRRCGFETITDLAEYRPDWLWCYGMPSPTYLDLDEDQLWYGPYIKPINKARRLDGKMRVGIKTSGNPKYDQDLHRSIPASDVIDALAGLDGAKLYSFHVEEDLDDPRVTSLREDIKSWDDTLDFIDQMDLVVSSCTSLAHAASAMGKETIVMVPILNYYTWARPGAHSKWYGESTRIVRQVEHDNWNESIRELRGIVDERKNLQAGR